MKFLFAKFLSDTSGVTMIEYCLVALLISITILFGVTNIGAEVTTFFVNIEESFPDNGGGEG